MCLLLFRSLGLLFHVMAMVTDQSELSGVVFSIGADEDLVLGEEKVLAVMGRHAGRSLQKMPLYCSMNDMSSKFNYTLVCLKKP